MGAPWVSIHAPAWGATTNGGHAWGKTSVSIHAPAWGATRQQSLFRFLFYLFQSTHPRGVRHNDGIYAISNEDEVSIHAPAWGATRPREKGPPPGRSFNPRTRVGCDWAVRRTGWNTRKFQSTHPRGVRPKRRPRRRPGPKFQSTHPRGVRRASATGSVEVAQFQSTHPRGVRPQVTPKVVTCRGFNPRTRVGCDRRMMIRLVCSVGFQSTHPRGVRRRDGEYYSILTGVSIHAPAWGATEATAKAGEPVICFNPRTRVGCDSTNHLLLPSSGSVSIHAPAWGATVSMFYPVDSRD